MLGVHTVERVIGENASAEWPDFEVRKHELGHVRWRGNKRCDRVQNRVRLFESLICDVPSKWLREGLSESAVAHLERRKNVLFGVVVERPPGNAFHDVGGQRDPVIGIIDLGTRLANKDWNMILKVHTEVNRLPYRRLGSDHMVVDSRCVRQKIGQCNCSAAAEGT